MEKNELLDPVWCAYYRIYLKDRERDDEFLANVVKPLFDQALQHFRYGFFIRYNDDGGYHIRLRFFGSRSAVTGAPRGLVTETINRSLEEFGARSVASKYQPEYERYGGKIGVRLAERVFFASSKLILNYLADESEKPGTVEFALASAELLLKSLGLSGSDRDVFYKENTWGPAPKDYPEKLPGLKQTFGPTLQAILGDQDSYWNSKSVTISKMAADFRTEIEKAFKDWHAIREEVGIPKGNLATDYIHMHFNRFGIFPAKENLLRLIRSEFSTREASAKAA